MRALNCWDFLSGEGNRMPPTLKIARLGDRFSALDRDLDTQADQLLD